MPLLRAAWSERVKNLVDTRFFDLRDKSDVRQGVVLYYVIKKEFMKMRSLRS